MTNKIRSIVAAMLVALALLVGPYAAAEVETPIKAAGNTPRQEALAATLAQPLRQSVVRPDTVEVMQATRGVYLGVASKVDAAGRTHVATAWENYADANQTWVILKVYGTAAEGGRILHNLRCNTQSTTKIDGVSLTNSGDDVLVDLVTHSWTPPAPPRVRQGEYCVFADVFTYTPQFATQEGGPGAYGTTNQPAPTPAPGACEPVDYARIQTMLNSQTDAIMRQLRTELAGCPTCSLRQGVEDKVKDALREERVINEAMYNGATGSHIIYQQEVNTSYTGSLGAVTAVARAQATQTAAARTATPTIP